MMDATACGIYGYMQTEGEGGAKDVAAGKSSFTQACNLGDQEACSALAADAG